MKNHVPLTRALTLDRQPFGVPFNLGVEFDRHLANLEENEFAAFDFETELRIGERLELALALEAEPAHPATVALQGGERLQVIVELYHLVL